MVRRQINKVAATIPNTRLRRPLADRTLLAL